MPVDVSAVTYFAPLFAFFVVLIIVFAVLDKSKILGETKWVSLLVSFIIASLFVSAAGVSRYITVITPWFAALLVSLFFLLVLIGIMGGKTEIGGGLRTFLIIVALVIFILSGIVVFSDTLAPYLPGSTVYAGSPITDWVYSPPVIGAIILLAITAIVSWVLIKAK